MGSANQDGLRLTAVELEEAVALSYHTVLQPVILRLMSGRTNGWLEKCFKSLAISVINQCWPFCGEMNQKLFCRVLNESDVKD